MALPEAVRYIFAAINDAIADGRSKGAVMDWARILAYVTGTVDQDLLARNEYLAAENRMAIDRKCRVVRNLVVKIEPAEPPIRKVKRNLLAKPPLETHAVAVADDQHPGS